ncbi:glycosyltransferase [Leptospira sp. 96542]|nr:glycosyltransferase [Leptospira sp. 96542]
MGKPFPRVLVLLATHNGFSWLPEQTGSLLRQQDVDLKLLISDDASSDGTGAWLKNLAASDSRVTLLPTAGPFGSAAKNFYRLLKDADWEGAQYVAFSDQDDIWHHDKLARSIALLESQGADAVSSNVVAVWPDGCRALVHKAQPQRKFDYLFEAAGPGCTYVMTVAFAREVRLQVDKLVALGRGLPAHHDWFCYALCRARGGKWLMDAVPTMEYRQHGGNEVGANSGARAARQRFMKIRSGWYRTEVLFMLRVSRESKPADPRLKVLALRLERGNFWDRCLLALQASQFRRRWRDRMALAFFFLSAWFWGGRQPS